jgi:hypothetical protein
VLADIYAWLSLPAHAWEGVFVVIKDKAAPPSTPALDAAVYFLIQQLQDSRLWCLSNTIPTLGEMR